VNGTVVGKLPGYGGSRYVIRLAEDHVNVPLYSVFNHVILPDHMMPEGDWHDGDILTIAVEATSKR
jgi:hypothetical protein